MILAAFSGGCRGPSSPTGSPSVPAPAPPASGTPSNRVQADRSEAPILPNPKLTPGATLAVTSDDLCAAGYAKLARDVPTSVKRQVYDEYGITDHAPGEYEVDHLISLELGGSNSVRNLWPESYRTRPWNAHVKDALEDELHRLVCAGQLDLKTAQRDIATNWIQSYQKYFHTDRPLAGGKSHHHRRSPPPSEETSAENAPANTTAQPGRPSNPEAGTSSVSEGAGEVWVNTRSGKYFHPGARYYGKTKEGEYMTEAEARRHGYIAARGE